MPSIIAKYLNLLSKQIVDNGTYAYRGQENEDWGVESAAYRRLKKESESLVERYFIDYHQIEILEPARMNGYGIRNGRKISDLELLAELQHFGAATCLIDFTRDFLVALWFACKICEDINDQKKNGQVFILNTSNQSIFQSLEQKDLEHDGGIKAILNFRTRDKGGDFEKRVSGKKPSYWHWSPHGISQRTLKQNSLFIFGEPYVGAPYVDRDYLKAIQIDGEDKESILRELEALGVTKESLFKDIPGFATCHAHDEPISPRYKSAEDYYMAGQDAFQRGEFKEAIRRYDEAIKINPSYVEAYEGRGFVKWASGDHHNAIKDWDYVIEHCPNHADAYNNRGLCKIAIGDVSGAVKDCGQAINLKPNATHFYYNLGMAYQQLKNTTAARESFHTGIEKAKQNNQPGLIPMFEERLSELDKPK